MGFIPPTLPVVDPAVWPQVPRLTRIRQLAPCRADNGFGTRRVVHVAYLFKCLLYAGGAVAVASLTTRTPATPAPPALPAVPDLEAP